MADTYTIVNGSWEKIETFTEEVIEAVKEEIKTITTNFEDFVGTEQPEVEPEVEQAEAI